MKFEGPAFGRCSIFGLCSCMSAVYLPVERQSAISVHMPSQSFPDLRFSVFIHIMSLIFYLEYELFYCEHRIIF